MEQPSSTGIDIPPSLMDLCTTVEVAAGSACGHRVRRAITRLFSDAMVRTGPRTIAVITGDIPAMWLRDSAWQLRPLLTVAHDDGVYEVLASVSRQQAEYVLIDPHANNNMTLARIALLVITHRPPITSDITATAPLWVTQECPGVGFDPATIPAPTAISLPPMPMPRWC